MIRTIHGLNELSAGESPLCLALGVFDGVHIGHQAVIRAAVERALALGGLAVVVTFEPHPIQVLAPAKAPARILASLSHKEGLLAEMGVQRLVVIEFTKDFASGSADDFVTALLRCGNLASIAVGEDWQFGKGRGGNGAFLEAFGQREGVTIDLIPPVMGDGERVSSTRIRQAIRDGNLAAASEMLGRPYSILGKVVKGRQLGRTIGFPTANIEANGQQLPPTGVWAVQIKIDGQWRDGIANLGKRPTVEQGEVQRLLEAFVFDWEGDLYGREIEVRFADFVRGEMKFSGVEELKDQIARDVAAVKAL